MAVVSGSYHPDNSCLVLWQLKILSLAAVEPGYKQSSDHHNLQPCIAQIYPKACFVCKLEGNAERNAVIKSSMPGKQSWETSEITLPMMTLCITVPTMTSAWGGGLELRSGVRRLSSAKEATRPLTAILLVHQQEI